MAPFVFTEQKCELAFASRDIVPFFVLFNIYFTRRSSYVNLSNKTREKMHKKSSLYSLFIGIFSKMPQIPAKKQFFCCYFFFLSLIVI